jgi:CHAT domain-containing protein/Tfp pilus assembly protein PilF
MKHRSWILRVVAILLLAVVGSASLDAQDAQEGSIEEAKQLSARVAELYGQGRYEEAIPLAQQTLAIREKLLSAEHPDIGESLNNLAVLYQFAGAYAKAEPLLQRALAIKEKTLGLEDPEIAITLNNLGMLYQISGAYTKAEPLFQRALAINEKALGPDDPGTASLLNHLADVYKDTGAYAKAERLYQRALAIREKALGPEHPDIAVSLDGLAELYRATGAYAKAELLYHRALAIIEKALGPDDSQTAASLNNLAMLYQTTGAYAKAETFYRRALAIDEKALGPDDSRTAASLNNLAMLYQTTGAYAKAVPLLERALAIKEKTLGPEDPRVATALNNLAMLYQVSRAYAKAESLYHRALAIEEKALGPEHPDITKPLINLAAIYLDTGAYAKVEPLLQRALAIEEKVLGPEHPDTAISLAYLATLYLDTGAYARAEPLYQRALAIREKVLGPEHPYTAESLDDLGALYQANGTYAKAEPLYKRAQVITESNTARFLVSGSEARKEAFLQLGVGSIWRSVSLSLAHPNVRSTALGLTSVLRYKGRVLDTVSDSIARLRRNATLPEQALFDQLSGVAQEFSTLTFRGLGKLSSEAYRQRLNELVQQQEKLEENLSTRSAALRQAVTPITLDGLREALPAEAALVEWFRYQPFNPKAKESNRWGAPRYVAYVLKRSGNPVPIDMGAAQPLEELVAEFRAALGDPATNNFKGVAKELYKTLVQPLLPHLANTKRLLLSPDGALNLLPFATLMGRHGQYLAQQYELTYLTSGRDLLRMADEPSTRGGALVVADPNYGATERTDVLMDASLQPVRSGDLDRSGMVFSALPGTAAEAKLLQSLLQLNDENVLTGDRATEDSLRELHGPRILHIATHGFFLNDQDFELVLKRIGFGRDAPPLPLGENPLLRSGLALAGANARHSGTNDDGILTAAEVAHLDLVGTQLVVLSACDTGVGTVENGEGVYGLRRALVLAGAQSQLVSLWNVADVATQELMLDYYQRLLKGEGRSEALRSAQLATLAKPERQHPYYWASFIPIGHWTPLTPLDSDSAHR